ncbi:biotin-dependent carboxyltransferase family protein [Vallicoccus soli]|uniref:Biotin-dependent carboxyltransferase family protein n=1 Tax=Vallicoccus soli TaxID=2339232 RepID=A0A3A3YXP0_9ACTN|nr:biotin-dependent carboxyltransferase family protein [Vallicoccus soli]RJK96418.1 biotin-dependent carboxyltransferase family protein [Vallicoccus soli]
MTARALEVLRPGALATVQDLGRPGLAALGVGRSGAADRASLRLANRVVGNHEGEACVEVTLGGLAVRAVGDLLVAAAGAPCPGTAGTGVPTYLADGEVLELGTPPTGLRTYLAVAGGLAVDRVLGSRSTDVLAGIGPPALTPGQRLPVGAPRQPRRLVDVAPVPPPPDGEVGLRVVPGPRDDWFAEGALGALLGGAYEVTADSNRVGMRLQGPGLERARDGELPSEGMVPGSLQVPPSGQPTLFLADHPVTGGYPVVAVVVRDDVDRAAQVRPGQTVRFRRAR